MIIKNARIHPGSGEAPFLGYVCTEGERITKVVEGECSDEGFDAGGRDLCPGFIDAHSHNDFFAGRQDSPQFFAPFVRQGITSFITGNCGSSAAGYFKDTPYSHLIGGGLFSIDGREQSDLPTFAQSIKNAVPLNIAMLAGHSTLRISLRGKGPEPLSASEMEKMLAKADQLMREGAAGVSLGLMYEPSQYAPKEELEELAKLVKSHDKILSVHARAFSKISTSYPLTERKAHNLKALEEMVELSVKTGVKLQYSHLIFVGSRSWDTVEQALKMMEEANEKGADMMFDMYSLDFGASILTVVLPGWYLSAPKEERNKRLSRIRLYLETTIARKSLGFDFEDILITNTRGLARELEGKTVAELAKLWRMEPLQAYLEALRRTEEKAAVLMYKYQSPQVIETLRNHPLALYMTDAWVESEGVQNYACYYSLPKFLKLALDHGTDLEEAIHKMSSGVAQRYGLKDRGSIREGNYADLVLIDLNRLGYTENKEEYPTGIEWVMNNGKVVLEEGELTPDFATSGQFLKV